MLSPDDIRAYTQETWDRFYSMASVWRRSRCVKSVRARVAFVLVSKLYRQMYANTGITTDSGRVATIGEVVAVAGRAAAEAVRRLADAGPRRAPGGRRGVGGLIAVRASLAVAAGVVIVAGLAGAPRLAARAPQSPPAQRQGPAAPQAAVPVLRAHRYKMAGRVRPLLFWISRDDVGLGEIVWRGGEGAVAFELLIGTDAAKAPHNINRWGYLVRDDIQRYIYFTYPDDQKLRLGLTFYAKEFQGMLKDANDREAAYDHANKMARHGECLFYLKGEESIDIRRALRARILNTRERSMAYITYSDNLGGRVIDKAPLEEWKDSCSFDVDETGGGQ